MNSYACKDSHRHGTLNVLYKKHFNFIIFWQLSLQIEEMATIDGSLKLLHLLFCFTDLVIIGAKEVECESLDDVMSLLESGSAVRHTGSTQMNEHSSRSHSVFTVNIGQ